MDEFEKLKYQLMSEIQSREEIPQDVIRMIEEIFRKIKEIYVENHCNSAFILDKLDIGLNRVRNFLNKNIAGSRRDEQVLEMQFILGKIEQSIEEEKMSEAQISDEELERIRQENNNCHLGMFNEFARNKITETKNRIHEMVEKTLLEINNLQRRKLSTIRVDDGKIQEISDSVKRAIRSFIDNEDQMISAFEELDKQSRDRILGEYRKYMATKESREMAERKSKKEKSRQQVFRDSLDASIFIGNQAELAEKSQKKVEVDKLAELIEALPESDLFQRKAPNDDDENAIAELIEKLPDCEL